MEHHNIREGGNQMYDTSKLRGRIIEKFGSQNAFSNAVNSSISFVSQYLNGHKNLDQKTIDKWADALEIEASDIPLFFFTKKVHETEH
jgi:transcriptional regulator with XRE-family HTH domain